MSETVEADFVIEMDQSNTRLDQVLAALMPEYSRSRLQQWIKQGAVTVNGKVLKPKEKVKVNDLIAVNAELEAQGEWLPEDIPLDIVYEDDCIIIINKPAGLVVHPAAGNYSGTLVNALLHHQENLQNVPRAGIVHRLDKETTGLMVVAKTLQAHAHIVDQLQERTMGREYEAVVSGVMTGGGTVDEAIARHPKDRKKMSVTPFGKTAITHYRLVKKYSNHTHIRVKLETGRTHQIRVHMAHINHALVGDPVYAGRFKIPAGITEEFKQTLRGFRRQALHAKKLTLTHPETLKEVSWEVPLPEDMLALIEEIEAQEQ
jgi:23S rRNA pseudouridine1911/1915/1917 synthase